MENHCSNNDVTNLLKYIKFEPHFEKPPSYQFEKSVRQVDFRKWIFSVKMSHQCTAGGFEVIPEQAQQYDLLKFYAFVVHCFFGHLMVL